MTTKTKEPVSTEVDQVQNGQKIEDQEVKSILIQTDGKKIHITPNNINHLELEIMLQKALQLVIENAKQ